jgi:hypothetical protein
MSGGPGQLDEQQAQLVERLQAAGGGPVSFDELRAIGIENPALLCYELAAVGLPVTRTSSPGEGMPALSVRLEPERRQQPAPELPCPPTSDAGEAVGALPPAMRARYRRLDAAAAGALGWLASARASAARLGRAGGDLRTARVISILGLAVTVVAVIAIVLAHQAGGGAGGVRAAGVRGSARKPSISAQARGQSRAVPATSAGVTAGLDKPRTPTHVSADAAVGFEAQGHQLLAEGSYATAIGNLLEAIRDSGQSLVGCIEPASEPCLTFAYALYDLGRALRLQGRDAEAVAVLRERLRIDNQRPTVEHELELARGARA